MPWAAFPGIPVTGTFFVEAFGTLTPFSKVNVAVEEDLYSVFRARAELMRWSAMQGSSSSRRYAAGPPPPHLWNMNEAEITNDGETSRIGFVQVGAEAGIDPCAALPPLLQCFDDSLRRFGEVELTGLQVTGMDFEPNEGSAMWHLAGTRNWFNTTRQPKTAALIAIDTASLDGRTEAELAAKLPALEFGSAVPLPESIQIERAPEIPAPWKQLAGLSGFALPLTLPEWTASAAGWALGLVLEELRFDRPHVRDFTLRIDRAG